MKAYFDTNVLVAALRTEHIHHGPSYAAADLVSRGAVEGYVSAHGLAEFYSVLSRSPFKPPPTSEGVLRVIERSILPFFKVIEVSRESHLAAIALCAHAGWRGGRIHDAVHIKASEQAGCDVLYTWNLSDFHAIDPASAGRIRTPPLPASLADQR